MTPFIHKLVRSVRKYRLKFNLKTDPLKIIIGSGDFSQKGWISTEIDSLNLLKPNEWKFFVSDNSIDAILAEHVWEHLSKDDGIIAAKTCFRFLKQGGYLRIAVPDGNHPDPSYIDNVKPNGTGPGCDDHQVLFTYKSLTEIFEPVGFQIDLLEYFDENQKFHFKNWSPEEGLIKRSRQFDGRNKNGELNYTSIIMDAKKPLTQ